MCLSLLSVDALAGSFNISCFLISHLQSAVSTRRWFNVTPPHPHPHPPNPSSPDPLCTSPAPLSAPFCLLNTMFTSRRIVLDIFQSPKCPRRFTDKSNNGKIIYFLLPQPSCVYACKREREIQRERQSREGMNEWMRHIHEKDYFNKKIITQICLAEVLLDSNCFKYSMALGCQDWVAQRALLLQQSAAFFLFFLLHLHMIKTVICVTSWTFVSAVPF